jgi:hypothetical protein
MSPHINALSAANAFNGVIEALEDVNCGNISYRLGVTHDNDGGWITGNNWNGADPWFDSEDLTKAEMANAFAAAASKVASSGGASLGCEHVLSSSVGLLEGDNTGFVRDGALLVLILLTDVDDYGVYDQPNGNTCGLGCNTVGQPVATLHSDLLAVKNNESAALAAIVIAGDPNQNGGVNFCNQPKSCANDIYHASRLWDFAGMLDGNNGFTSSLCQGANSVPTAVETAFQGDIDLACQMYEPEG